MDDTYQGVLQVARAAPHVVIRQCAVLGSVCALFALAVPAHAQDRSVVVERRDGDATIARSGDVRLVETWTVRFIGGPFHFAYRAIPLNRVESIDGWGVAENGQAYGKGPTSAGERYFVVDNSGNQSKITWYFPPTTDQARTFILSYTLHGALRIYSRGDQFFWKFVESDRPYPINAARVIVHLPAAFPADQIRATTYLNGQEHASGARRINAETVSFRGGPFAPGQEWEIRTQFPHGAVTASAPAWQVREQRARLGTSGTPNILFGVACPRPSTCVAVGARFLDRMSARILRTTDGGNTWRSQPSGAPNDLQGACVRRPRLNPRQVHRTIRPLEAGQRVRLCVASDFQGYIVTLIFVGLRALAVAAVSSGLGAQSRGVDVNTSGRSCRALCTHEVPLPHASRRASPHRSPEVAPKPRIHQRYARGPDDAKL